MYVPVLLTVDISNKFINVIANVGPNITCCYKALCSLNTKPKGVA